MARYRYLGTDDEASTCSCCGKRGLKRVVWLAELDEDGNEAGEAAHYGTTCAGHLLRGGLGKKPTVSQANDVIAHAKARSKAQFHDEFSQALDATAHLKPPAPTLGRGRSGQYVVIVGDVQETYAGSFETDPDESWRRWSRDKTSAANRAWHERRALEHMTKLGQRTDLASAHIGNRMANPDDDFDDEDDSDAPQSYRDFNAWIRALKARKNEFIEEHRKIFERDGIVVVPGYDGRYQLVLTRGTTSPYRVTDFIGDEPTGHSERDKLDEALALLWEDATPEYKRAPPMPKRATNPGARATKLARRVGSL
jgi:hypothetical protein